MTVRRLKEGDESNLAAFLARYANTTMHIRSNLKVEGFAWEGKRQQGIYYGAFDEDNNIVGVLGYFWNGNILMQPEGHLADLINAIRSEDLELKGLLGPAADVREAIALLELQDWPMQLSADEAVYVLDLDQLDIPDALAQNIVTARPMTEQDRALAIEWRIAFNIESLGAEDGHYLREDVEAEVDAKLANGTMTVLERDNVPVAMCGGDKALPDSVTIGPVWTPPEHRNNGYARAVVAGALQQAYNEGCTRSVLFTDNPAAVKAYEAVGFREVDKYGLTLFARPFRLAPL